ncbi:hypothetical protein D3C75_630100 [compost metagenome]
MAGILSAAQLGQDLLQRGASAVEELAVQEHGGHAHNFLLLHLILEHTAVNHGMGNARIEHAHHVQSLYHIGAVMAGQADIGFKMILTLDGFDLPDDTFLHLGRPAAHLQQCKHQRGKLMAQGNTGKHNSAFRSTCAVNTEAWRSRHGGFLHADPRRHACDLLHQSQHLGRCGIRSCAYLQEKVTLQKLQVLGKLRFNICF